MLHRKKASRIGLRKSPVCLTAGTVGVLLSGYLLYAPGLRAEVVTARSTAAFIDSMGVNVHLNYYDTVYTGQYASFTKPRLQELGLRHIRDVLNPGNVGPGSQTAFMQDLYTSYGIKTTLSAGPGTVAAGQVVPSLKTEYGVNILDAVEGPNEPDINPGQFSNGDWVNGTRQYMQSLYNYVKGDPATAGLPIIATALVRSDSSVALGNIAAWTTYGGMHPYSRHGPGDVVNQLVIGQPPQWNLPTGSEAMTATEFGWTTCGNEDNSVTETVHGKYVPRGFLEHFRIGVKRSWSYQLLDFFPDPYCNDTQLHFGLLRYDNTPKPAFTGVKNLVSLLKDETAFSPSSLDYSLTGSTANVHQLLLQKSNGEFYLVLWNEVDSNDSDTTAQVVLNLNTPIAQAAAYLTNNSTTAFKTWTNPTQLSLNVPDQPLVIKLVRASGGGGGGTSGTPDLVVSATGYSATTLTIGAPIRFTATVTNVGNGPTPAGTVLGVGFFFNGQPSYYYNDQYTLALAPGQSVTLTSLQTWTPSTSGNVTIKAWVDDVNRIPESNENNNTLNQTLSITRP